jgi:serine acetyltransferase
MTGLSNMKRQIDMTLQYYLGVFLKRELFHVKQFYSIAHALIKYGRFEKVQRPNI